LAPKRGGGALMFWRGGSKPSTKSTKNRLLHTDCTRLMQVFDFECCMSPVEGASPKKADASGQTQMHRFS
jgi:hypothetical protein